MEINIDRSRTTWWVFGVAIAGGIGYFLLSFIGTIVFGLFIYYASRPLNRQLQRRLPSPSLAAALSLLALSIPTLLLLAYTFSTVLTDLQDFLAGVENSRIRELVQPHLAASSSLQRPGTLLTDVSSEMVQGMVTTALGYVGFIGNGLLHVFIMFVLAFYLLRDDRRIGTWLYTHFGGEEGNVTAYLAAVDRDLHNIFFGNLLNILLTGVIGAITFTLLNDVSPAGVEIPHPALLGFLTGVASLVPVVGMKAVIIPLGGFLLTRAYITDASGGYWFAALFLVVALVVVDFIPDLVLRPYVSAREIHTGLVMIAYLFGPLLFGWYGLFLGPLLLVIVVQFADQILPDLMAGRPITTASTQASVKGQVKAESSPLFVDVDWEHGVESDSGDGETEAVDGDESATIN